MLNRMILGLSFPLMLVAACDDSEPVMLELELTNVPDLGADFVYEGWLVTADGPVSSGRFTVSESGVLSPSSFEIDDVLADEATAFVLTIEPAAGDDPAPAETHLLAGTMSADSAELTTSDAAALGTNFASATGSYILATPSTANDDTDNTQGIWWLAPGGPSASLALPALPNGWLYEGWVVGGDGPVSTGTFAAPNATDSDGAGSAAGPDSAPPFPGQDFIDPEMDLIGGAAVVSVEPDPDNSPAPFIIKPLVDDDIEALTPPAAQDMANNAAATLPAGTATVMR